jgi:RNA polymerase sigma-70 factor (ECF subfamily)
MLRHHDDASDAVQQAFVVALRKQHSIPHDNLWPWLAAVISREARHIRRKRARTVTLEPGDSMPTEDVRAIHPLSELERSERDAQLAQALGDLSPDERDALLLTQLGGTTYAQAATALEVPLGTLNHRVSRAFATLRRKLGKDERAVASSLALLPAISPPAGLREALSLKAATVSAGAAIIVGGVVVKKTLVASLALLLLVLLAVGGVLAFFPASPSEGENGPLVAGRSYDRDNVRSTEDLRGSAQDAPMSAASDGVGMNESVDTSTDHAPKYPDSPDVVHRVLVATDPDGRPVSVNFIVEWRTRADELWVTQRVKTDADGRAALDAPVDAMLRVNLDEREWLLGWDDVLVTAGKEEAPVTVYGILPARVRITYSDGKPYVGLLTVKARGLWHASLQMVETPGSSEPLKPGWPRGRGGYEGFHEIAEFGGLPKGVDLIVATRAKRPGFGEVERTISATELAAGGLIDVVVPEGISPNTPGKIVVNLQDAEIPARAHRLYRIHADGSKEAVGWNSKDRLESGGVRAGRYLLLIFGSKVWSSGEFDLSPGETKELQADSAEPSSLRVRVVDDSGSAIESAVLSLEARERPWSFMMSGRDGKPNPYAGEAVSGVDGVANLKQFPAGTFKFQIYAGGKQPWVGYVNLLPGQDYDLGEIVLEAARGKIVARFPDWDFTKRHVTWSVVIADGNWTIASGTVDKAKLVIEGIPVGRRYKFQTGIPVPGRGSRAFWYTKGFELTPAAPTHELDGTDQKWPDDLD